MHKAIHLPPVLPECSCPPPLLARDCGDRAPLHPSPQTRDWAGGFLTAWGQERLQSLKMPPGQVPPLLPNPSWAAHCPPVHLGQMEGRSVGQSQLLPTSNPRPTPTLRGCEQHPPQQEEGVPGPWAPTVPSVIAVRGDAVTLEGFQAQ